MKTITDDKTTNKIVSHKRLQAEILDEGTSILNSFTKADLLILCTTRFRQEEIYMYFGPKMARTSLSMIQKSNYHYSILYVKILKNWIHTNSN
jgi:hypothetical protein